MTDRGGCIVDPDPSIRYIFGTAEEGVGKGGVATINSGDCQGMLFTYEFIGLLLSLAGEVAISELVAVKALMSTSV